MKKQRDEPYILSCLIGMVFTLYLSRHMVEIPLNVPDEPGRTICYIVLAELLFVVLQKYLLMIFRGYKKYFENHK